MEIEKIREINDQYTEITSKLIKLARIKASMCFSIGDEYRQNYVMDGHFIGLSFSEDAIWIEFRHGSYDDESICIEAEDLNLSEEEFTEKMKSEYSHLIRAKETHARMLKHQYEESELATLARLQKKYGTQVFSKQ